MSTANHRRSHKADRPKAQNPDHVARRAAKELRRAQLDAWRAVRDSELKPYGTAGSPGRSHAQSVLTEPARPGGAS